MKRVILIAGGFTIAASCLFLGMLLSVLYHPPPEGRGRKIRVTITKGESFSLVAKRLNALGLIRRPGILSAYAVVRHYDRSVHAGTYEVTVGERPINIIEKLIRGEVLQAQVTIPEGSTVREIAGLLSPAGIDSAGFADYALSAEAAKDFALNAPNLEGYLFPETYVFLWGANPRDIAIKMVNKLRSVFKDSLVLRASEIGMNVHQVLTLASIIEEEARLPEERPLISAVYHRRLKRKMKLEADPTVSYALGGKKKLLTADLKIKSPYNTYINSGLPPGPICNPGKASILAALYPDSSSRALYFVAQGDGGHIFSLTLREHLQAINKVKKLKRQRARARATNNGR